MRVDRRELAAIFARRVHRCGRARASWPSAARTTRGHWPWATFLVNLAGAFALGYFTTRLQERLPLSAYRRPFLGTGLCGAPDDLLDHASWSCSRCSTPSTSGSRSPTPPRAWRRASSPSRPPPTSSRRRVIAA